MHSLAIKARERTEHRRGKNKKKHRRKETEGRRAEKSRGGRMNRTEKQRARPRLLLQ